MNNRPLLILPAPAAIEPKPRNGGGGKSRMQLPGFAVQQKRLDTVFSKLRSEFETKRARWQHDSTGVLPEEVLVFETAGSIKDFQKAVENTPELEWLAEWEGPELAADDDFFDIDDASRNISDRLFLTSANHLSLAKIESLWKSFKKSRGTGIDHGYGPWRHLFHALRDIRFWSAIDRIRETGLLEQIEADLALSTNEIHIEAELWYSTKSMIRTHRYSTLRNLVEADGGTILSQSVISEVRYHGVLISLPSNVAANIINPGAEPRLLDASSIMFFRPTGQTISVGDDSMDERIDDGDSDFALTHTILEETSQNPTVALLDGYPLANHVWLKNRVEIDDPDSFEDTYPAQARVHGTAMASLILKGDASERNSYLRRPIYVRPILKVRRDLKGRLEEYVPDDRLPVDLFHDSFVRLFDESSNPPHASHDIRIVNFSIGNDAKPFDRSMSSWGRLFDWLAWKYGVLVIVSAGNVLRGIELDLPKGQLSAIGPDDRDDLILRAVIRDAGLSRILSPGEAINVLTIGAIHADNFSGVSGPSRIECFPDTRLPSPISRVGFGYRGAVKPELLFPGGRQVFREPLTNSHSSAILELDGSKQGPGQLVAGPSPIEGETSRAYYTRGTSNAAALATRAAAQLLDNLFDLHHQMGQQLPRACIAPVLKALLVHGASWPEGHKRLTALLSSLEPPDKIRHQVGRFVGYGEANLDRTFGCTDFRVTGVGYGEFDHPGAQAFQFPLPASLTNRRDWRRLTLTLAWQSPTIPSTRAYRNAVLWLSPSSTDLGKRFGASNSLNVDGRDTSRGTVQHQTYEGKALREFIPGDCLKIQVYCAEDAGPLNGKRVPYGIAITLETAEESEIRIYDEIVLQLRQPITI